MKTRLASIVVVAWLFGALFAPSFVHANDEVDEADVEAAKRHFHLGLLHYDRGAYSAALTEFEIAKRLRPAPALDYNIARVFDRLEQYTEAIAAYERYLTGSPAANDADKVRKRVALLKARMPSTNELASIDKVEPKTRPLPKDPPEPAPVVLAPVPAPILSTSTSESSTNPLTTHVTTTSKKRPVYKQPWLWIGVGVGAGLIATGVALGVVYSRPHNPDVTLGTIHGP